MKKFRRKIFFVILGIAVAIGFLVYIIKYAADSEAKPRVGRPYFWCATYKDGQPISRYCYGDSGFCQIYNLLNKKPKDNLKKGLTYGCYSEKVYVRRKGTPCPPDDYVIENKNGGSVGCFGGFKEKNLKILKDFKKQQPRL